jgi:hypothetical protein
MNRKQQRALEKTRHIQKASDIEKIAPVLGLDLGNGSNHGYYENPETGERGYYPRHPGNLHNGLARGIGKHMRRIAPILMALVIWVVGMAVAL